MAIVIGVALAACADATSPPREPFNPGDPPLPTDLVTAEIRPFRIQTFEGSGETVHPDIAVVPQWWRGSSWRLVATPYPNGDAQYENPSEYIGESWTEWEIPQGLTNPVVKPKQGYLSDPDQLYNPATDELWMYYRQVMRGNLIWLVTSKNGVRWSLPREVLRAPNHQIVSPSIVRVNDSTWYMWSINAGAPGCAAKHTIVERRRSTDGMTWSAPEPVTLDTPPGVWPWHIDVEWVPAASQYWAAFNVKDSVGCVTGELEFATSTDGITWTVAPSPLITRHAIPDFADIVYRASFVYHPTTDFVTFWYSGARYDQDSSRYVWHTAIQRIPREALMARVNQPRRAPFAARAGDTQPTDGQPTRGVHRPLPPLTNETAP